MVRRRHRVLRRALSLSAVLALLLGVTAVTVPAQATDAPTCFRHDLSVTLPPTSAAGAEQRSVVATWLCLPATGRPATVHVTVAGTTYDHHYWDFPFDPNRYSYVRHLTEAGNAVLNYDRTGTGDSGYPAATDVTLDTHVSVLHQLVQLLRAGAIGGRAFSRVITVGHSQGSMIAATEARTYSDVDGLILTGWVHSNGSKQVALPSSAFFWPAQTDPRFASVPPGYLTSRPGSRGMAFYYASNADPAAIATDEATKTVSSAPEGPTAIAFGKSSGPEPVGVPVLSVLGDRDLFFCTNACSDPGSAEDPRVNEPSHWAHPDRVTVCILPNSGHDVDLHLNAPDWFAEAARWSADPSGSTTHTPLPCARGLA